jgi:hypothetical protein
MNRHAALVELNDRINDKGSGYAEWSRRTESNNSFDPTRLSLAFINLVARAHVVYDRRRAAQFER